MREFGDSVEPQPGEAVEALEERMGTHMEAIEALAGRIHETPARTWDDVALYAEVCCWFHWAGIDPRGPGAGPQMKAGPFSYGGMCDEALAGLLKAIFAMGRPEATASTVTEATR